MTKIKLSDQEFQRLRTIIYDRSGIYFADNKRYVLESRLGRRLEELEMASYNQYIQFLSIGPYREDEFQEMFNRITINETSFFRNDPQLSVFEKKILPKIMQARQSVKRIRIWSSACSTGEEPYTLAIMFHRTLGMRLREWRIEILGSDISEKALMTAKEGKYTSYSIRSTDQTIVKRYLQENRGYYTIDPEIKNMVRFEKLNLKDRFAARRHGTWDVIFCRNVMIYFDMKMREHCYQMFYDQMAPDGYLFIGHSESIRDSKLFSPIPEPQAFAYSKLAKGGSNVSR